MKQIQNIAFIMDNMELIFLKNEEIVNMEISETSDRIVKIGRNVVSFKSTEAAFITLSTAANHTYNACGKPSKKTIFEALCDGESTISAVRVAYDDDNFDDYFIPDYLESRHSVDEYGNVSIVIGYDTEDEDECDDFDCGYCSGCEMN